MIPFAFFGVDYYFRGGSTADTVATDRQGQDLAGGIRPGAARPAAARAADDGPQFRPGDVRQSRGAIRGPGPGRQRSPAGGQGAGTRRFRVSDAQLRETIASIPAFQDGGKFSPERYELYLIGQSTNRLAFEEKVRQDMLAAAVQEPIAAANIVARPSTEKFLGLLEQQREVAIAVVNAEPFVKDVKVDDADGQGVLRQEPGGVPDAGTGQDRIPDPDRRCACWRERRSMPRR